MCIQNTDYAADVIAAVCMRAPVDPPFGSPSDKFSFTPNDLKWLKQTLCINFWRGDSKSVTLQ